MPTPRDLVHRIEQRVLCRTHGRVRRVAVQVDEQRVVLYGDSATYYAKQLAQQAVSEIVAGRVLVNAIQVRMHA